MGYLTTIAQFIDPEYSELIEENKQLHSDIDGYIETMDKLQKENEMLKNKINSIKNIIECKDTITYDELIEDDIK